MTLTNGKSTRSSNSSEASGTSITSYSGWVTVTYGAAGNLRRIYGMRRNLSISFTASIRRSLNGDWTCRSGIGRFIAVVLFLFIWNSGRYKRHRYAYLPPTTGGGVSPSTECAVSQHIEQWLVVGRVKSCGGVRIGFDSIWMCFLLFIHVCGSPGGPLLNGGMM